MLRVIKSGLLKFRLFIASENIKRYVIEWYSVWLACVASIQYI